MKAQDIYLMKRNVNDFQRYTEDTLIIGNLNEQNLSEEDEDEVLLIIEEIKDIKERYGVELIKNCLMDF